MMNIKATSYLACTKQILVIAIIIFVTETLFNHTQEQIKTVCMYVCSHSPTQKLVFQEKGFKYVRKEQIIPLGTGLSWENFYKLLRLCLLIAGIIQRAGRCQPVVQLLSLLGCRSICLAGFVLLASQPWNGRLGYLPDSCFSVLKKQHGEV